MTNIQDKLTRFATAVRREMLTVDCNSGSIACCLVLRDLGFDAWLTFPEVVIDGKDTGWHSAVICQAHSKLWFVDPTAGQYLGTSLEAKYRNETVVVAPLAEEMTVAGITYKPRWDGEHAGLNNEALAGGWTGLVDWYDDWVWRDGAIDRLKNIGIEAVCSVKD